MKCINKHYDTDKWLRYDARGIPLAYACQHCEEEVMGRYREDVLTDPNYWHDEPIDEDF